MSPGDMSRGPVTSYGVCIERTSGGDKQYLIVQRRDSLAFAEFLRGRYDPGDTGYITTLVGGMTHDERARLNAAVDGGFDKLWGAGTMRHKDYKRGKSAFDRSVFNHPGCISMCLSGTTGRESPEWGLPKGRRSWTGESGVDCALRELAEETGLSSSHVALTGSGGVRDFRGGNGVQYRHVFYNATLVGACGDARPDLGEIRAAVWANVQQLGEIAPDVLLLIESLVSRPGGLVKHQSVYRGGARFVQFHKGYVGVAGRGNRGVPCYDRARSAPAKRLFQVPPGNHLPVGDWRQ